MIDMTLTVRAGVDDREVEKFILHLMDAGTPMAEHFITAFGKLGGIALPGNAGKSDSLRYLYPSPEEFERDGYADKLRSLMMHVAEF